MIFVLGHGHSGTRVIASMLEGSGVYMGETSPAMDHGWGEPVFEAARLFSRQVQCRGLTAWSFPTSGPSEEAVQLIEHYLKEILDHEEPKGVKFPELSLVAPWLVQMFPEAHFIWWERDPRHVISKLHFLNDLSWFGVPTELDGGGTASRNRCVGWAYVHEIMSSISPRRLLKMPYEEYVGHQPRALQKLEAFLGLPLRPTRLKRTKRRPLKKLPAFFDSYLKQRGVYTTLATRRTFAT